MKKLYVLCLLTLAAVVLDIALFHSKSAHAQAVPGVRIDRLIWNHTTGYTTGTVPTLGRIVGFHCVDSGGIPQCFVASASN